eukprot:GEMP01011716.1.p1 GENE.GEMP01011716.1~~GEMP01011716.1.p1  ORF type:complete len:748 (+),score=158.19 GEMP01011716.1:306-2549(+)
MTFRLLTLVVLAWGAAGNQAQDPVKGSGNSDEDESFEISQDRDDISFADDLILLDADGQVSKNVLEEYASPTDTESVAEAWKTKNASVPETDFASFTGMHVDQTDTKKLLFVYGGKAYACRQPVEGFDVDAVADAVIECYRPDRPRLTAFYIQRISILDHLNKVASGDFGPRRAPPLPSDATFDSLFERLNVRGYGWMFVEDTIPVPFYKWHVSKTRISSFDEQHTREGFFGDKLKIPWNHLVDKFRTSREKLTINESGHTKSTLDNAPTRFLDRIVTKAFPGKDDSGIDYWKTLATTMDSGSDSLEFSKRSNYYSNLMPGGRVPFTGGAVFFKAGPRVNYDGKVTFKIARNVDGSFDVNYSFLRGFDIKAVLAAGAGFKQLRSLGAGVLGAVILRPYKKQREWNFVQKNIDAASAADLLHKFSDDKLTDMSSFVPGKWKVTHGADVSVGLGVGYNLLASAGSPSVTFSESPEDGRKTAQSFGTELPALFGNVAVTRTLDIDPETGKASDPTFKLTATAAAENTVQTYWTIEPPELSASQDDGVAARIKGDTEDGGQAGLYAKSMVINEQKKLTDLVTKGKVKSGDSNTLDFKPTFQGRGHPQFVNPVKEKFGSTFYKELLTRAEQAMELRDHKFDKRIVSFNIKYELTAEEKIIMEERHKQNNNDNWEVEFEKERKEILKKPKNHPQKVNVDVSMTASKEYKKGGTFGLPFFGRQQDAAAITVAQKYTLFNKYKLDSTFRCSLLPR